VPIDWIDLHAQMEAAASLESRIALRLRFGHGLRTLDETTQDMIQFCELRSRIQATLWRALLQARVADARKSTAQALYNRVESEVSERGRCESSLWQAGADRGHREADDGAE
jgi:hypothetical protein